MARYVCPDCGDNVKQSDLRKLYRDGGTQKWVCKECYATYPDDEDEDEEILKPKGETVELLREKEPKKDSVEVINLKGKLKEAEEVRDNNYDLYTKAKIDLKMMKEMYPGDVLTAELKLAALNQKYIKLRWIVNNKIILKRRHFLKGFFFGCLSVAIGLTLIFSNVIMGW